MGVKERIEQIKQQFPNLIILFKRGDKYVCYENDARIISMYLGVSPNIFGHEGMLSCEFDYLSLNNLQKQLRKIGFEVALSL